MPAYVRVAIARPIPDPLTYAVPAEWSDKVRVGQVVVVPFGPRGGETGYILELSDEPGFDPAKIKPISRILDETPSFDARQLEFFRWIADYYMAPLGLVIHGALPSEVQAKTLNVLEPTEEGVAALTRGEATEVLAAVLREAIRRPGLTKRGLLKKLEADAEDATAERALEQALKRGWLVWAERESQEMKGKVRTATLLIDPAQALLRVPANGKRMRAVIDALAAGPQDIARLTADLGATVGPALRRLEELKVISLGEREDRESLHESAVLGAVLPPELNPEQQTALAALHGDSQGTFLLWGVTGSGKTEVFLGAAQQALDKGRQVLVLVPEIGLTPQLVGRFKARFGDRIAVLHSGLTGKERLAQWRRIRAGEASVAVGARSALFAPFQSLGLIVVDEEHDDSYKQDDGVKYHARDLAVVLGKFHSCSVVLASATPSLESWQNAQLGRYHLLRLLNRATPRPVPNVEVLDLTEMELQKDQPRPLFHPRVVDALKETFAGTGKAIVLYNRRGYATMVQCTSCGGTYECPNCGVTMTLHRQIHTMACHYCGLKIPYDGNCPACKKPTLEELGKGTERVVEELSQLFPEIPIGRMDADTTAVRGEHHRLLQEFRDGGTRLLVGTQIVAKGHDFPDVQVAVVVSADHGFRLPDFRSAERTWALLVQVAGRAGRGQIAGKVMVQTWTPEHYVLEMLNDPEGFYAAESKIRKTLMYPPFSRLGLIRVEGLDRRKVVDSSGELAKNLRSRAKAFPGVDVLGPSPAALAKLVGRWRWQIILRGRDIRAFRDFLRSIRPLLDAASRQGTKAHLDVDPRSLM